ncbi:MAG TPA: PQQ-binding-like beta-propeller repeat protein [Planctomycetota bacterium]|nr:PQQ-binding-like beta-propeller repeat protein [Planctomycetota bacterium]
MALRGDLASVDLAQVFQMLALNRKVGLLSIQSAKMWKVLYFDQRGVTVHHNVHRVLDRVVAGLVRTGRLSAASVDEVRDHAAREGRPLTDSLLAGGYLEATELEEQYRTEIEEEIYSLFFCRDAKFEFHEGAKSLEGYVGAIDERFFFNCDSVIMEAARRIDEWAYISQGVPNVTELFVATAESIDAQQFGPDGPAIFELLDGRRNCARIIEMTGLSTFQVCKVISNLLEAGAIAPLASSELLPLAKECFGEGRLQDAINLYERAIAQGIGVPEVHSMAAKAYQAAEQFENAIYHLECEAEHRKNHGDRAGAAKRLLEVRNLVPTDLQARERLVDLTLGASRVSLPDFDPIAEGKELVDLLLELGDLGRVRTVLEHLLLCDPRDPDLKKALVNVHLKAGDQKRVMELYESIAEDLVRQGKPLEGVAYLQKVLQLDRTRGDIADRVRKLYEFDERSRRRGRTLSGLAALFVLLLAVGCGYWFYNDYAETEFAGIDVREQLAREDFAGAAGAYQTFISTFPLTTSVAAAEGELQKIEAARQRYEARKQAERAALDAELNKVRETYKREWDRHREQFLAGHPEEAMQSLDKVVELVKQAGMPRDTAWALEQQVERSQQRLKEFLVTAEQLAGEYDTWIAGGEWQKARAIALRLHAEFEATASARRVAIPVLVSTVPSGAKLLRDGVVLEQTVGDEKKPVTTPAVVSCFPGQNATLVAEREGFQPQQIALDWRQEQIELALEIMAARRLTFDEPAQTGVGVGEGWLAVGLRGGRLAVVRTDGTGLKVHRLDGLRQVDSVPVVQNARVFFTTNENTIECIPLETSQQGGKWPQTVAAGFGTELTVDQGRVAVVDRENVLHCWEQVTGSQAWSASIGSTPSGACTIKGRLIYVGTLDGRVMIFDASDGSRVDTLKSSAGLVTRVLADAGILYFGCADGSIRAVEESDGRIVWNLPFSRALADGEIALGKGVVLAIGADNHLVAIDRTTGIVSSDLTLNGTPQRSLRVRGNRALLQLRRPKSKTRPAHDLLQSIMIDSMTVQWEHADSGFTPGAAGMDDLVVGMPTADGEVILIR